MAVGDAHVFPDFLTPILTQLSFQSDQLLFSHASAEQCGQAQIVFDKVGNIVAKKKMLAFSSLTSPFSKTFFPMLVSSQDCVLKD